MSRIYILVVAALSCGAFGFAQDQSDRRNSRTDPDMQRAIQFQRAKDRADARQARKERAHPSAGYSNADRSAEPNRTPDPGERQWKKSKNIQ